MKGRFIGENVHLIFDEIEYLETNKQSGLLFFPIMKRPLIA